MIHAFQKAAAFLALGALLAFSGLAGEEAAKPVVSREPLRLTKGGTPDQPAVFDGKGMTIDLGTDVTDHAWKKEGAIWTSSEPLLGPTPIPPGGFTGLFVDGRAITIARDRIAERALTDKTKMIFLPPDKLKPGQMGATPEGLLYFRWPDAADTQKARIILPAKGNKNCVSIECSHIIVKNLTVMHAGNDGFNIHGKWVGIRIENVKAFYNADEGISAHDDVQMDVDGAEIAWNGSQAGGIADVNRCITTYKNCRVHDNVGAAFWFTGKSHTVTDTVIYNQSKDFVIDQGAEVKQERVEFKK